MPSTSWFVYTGSGSVYDPVNYVTTLTPVFSVSGSQVNNIFASTVITGGVVRPVIDSTLTAAITTALNTGKSSTSVYLTFP
jgi:hypothetical protein